MNKFDLAVGNEIRQESGNKEYRALTGREVSEPIRQSGSSVGGRVQILGDTKIFNIRESSNGSLVISESIGLTPWELYECLRRTTKFERITLALENTSEKYVIVGTHDGDDNVVFEVVKDWE